MIPKQTDDPEHQHHQAGNQYRQNWPLKAARLTEEFKYRKRLDLRRERHGILQSFGHRLVHAFGFGFRLVCVWTLCPLGLNRLHPADMAKEASLISTGTRQRSETFPGGARSALSPLAYARLNPGAPFRICRTPGTSAPRFQTEAPFKGRISRFVIGDPPPDESQPGSAGHPPGLFFRREGSDPEYLRP